MLSTEQVAAKFAALKRRSHTRDQRMADITAVRRGDMESVYPDMFPEGMSKPLIANFVDVAARDIAEVLAPLPSFNCGTIKVNNDRAKSKSDTRTLIANNYIQFSGLQTQMYTGADWYITYAFLPIFVDLDVEARMPRIRVENPMGAYPEFDRYGRCVSYSKIYMKTVAELIIDFPEHESRILGINGRDQDYEAPVELVRYEDKDQIVLFLPQRGDTVLSRIENPLKKLSVTIARRPGLDLDDPRGQFDDVLWAQIARARFSLLGMEAAEKSVYAPLVVPNDIDDFAIGPDAVIRTNNPAGVRRVGLELPTAAFSEQQMLEQEMRMGSRYPEGRSGQMDASIITGSGVQALLGGFDSQIKAGQQILAEAFERVISLCFEVDEKFFSGDKVQHGTFSGAPYVLSYNSAKDVKGDYTVQVRYGLMSGLDPSRALIFSLQAMQAGLVSRDFVMRELPWSMNVAAEQDRIEVEKMRDALAGAFSGLTQAIPAMASSGADPSDIIEKVASVIEAKRRGVEIEDAVLSIFKKPEEPEQPAPVEAPQEPQPPQPGAPVEGAPMAGPPPNVQAILAQLGG